jgi:hypothetical protein
MLTLRWPIGSCDAAMVMVEVTDRSGRAYEAGTCWLAGRLVRSSRESHIGRLGEAMHGCMSRSGEWRFGQSIWRRQVRHAHRPTNVTTASKRRTKRVRPAIRINHSIPEVKPLTD